MKITTRRAILFYAAAVVITVVVWFGLVRFARLPEAVHHKFVAGIFLPFLIAVIVSCNWIEKKRREQTRSSMPASKSGEP